MEYWDLYDENRQPLGRKYLRGDKFNEGEYYVCCEIWVMNSKGEFLTTKRHPDKKSGNMWEFSGGGTLAGETTLQSAVRELFEETGIRTDAEELKLIGTYAHKNYFMDIFAVGRDLPIEDIVLQEGETVEAKWATPEEIQRMIDSGEFVYSVGVRYGLFKDKITFADSQQ